MSQLGLNPLKTDKHWAGSADEDSEEVRLLTEEGLFLLIDPKTREILDVIDLKSAAAAPSADTTGPTASVDSADDDLKRAASDTASTGNFTRPRIGFTFLRVSSLLAFSSLKADYQFHFGNHWKESIINSKIIDWADAIVLEHNPDEDSNVLDDLASSKQYRSIVREVEAGKKPIFFPDMHHYFNSASPDKKMVLFALLGVLLLSASTSALLSMLPIYLTVRSSFTSTLPWGLKVAIIGVASLPVLASFASGFKVRVRQA